MEIVIETCLDSIKMLPFLFFAFLLIEFLEYYSGEMSGKLLKKVGKAGPVVGAVLGCVPQCGFSVLAANLYAGGVLSAGTLIAVFAATSDEAVLILMANPGRAGEIIWLLAVKVVIAVAAGYFVDGVMQKYIVRTEKNVHIKPRETVRPSKMEVVREAIGHTFRIFAYLFVFNLILNFAIELLGIQKLSEILLGNTVFQPIIAAIIGLISDHGVVSPYSRGRTVEGFSSGVLTSTMALRCTPAEYSAWSVSSPMSPSCVKLFFFWKDKMDCCVMLTKYPEAL